MADISFISAGIGHGKSLFGARQICLELKNSERMIVTNLPMLTVDAPEGYMTVGEWCHEYVDRPIDVASRLLVIPQEKQRDWMPEFFRRYPVGRGTELVMPWLDEQKGIPDLQWRSDKQMKGEMPIGCLFVLDEVHFFFGAREWQKIGKGVEYYRAQLRKLNDDLLLITQHVEKVDKNFRRDATEFIYLTNLSKRRLFAGVTLDGRFRYQSYPGMAQRGDSATSSGWLQLKDKNYHKVYLTMAGVGLTGQMSPEGNRMKGRHWSVWVAIALAFAVFCWFVPRWVMGGVNGLLLHSIGGAHGKVASMVGAMPGMSTVRGQDSVGVMPRGPVQDARFSARASVLSEGQERSDTVEGMFRWQNDVIVSGFEIVEGRTHVLLSDGADFWLGDGHFTKWLGRVAIIDGYAFRFLSLAERIQWEKRHEDFVISGGASGSLSRGRAAR